MSKPKNPTTLTNPPSTEEIRNKGEINILIGRFVHPTDVNLVLGPLTEDDLFWRPPPELFEVSWPDLMAILGFFPSRSQARKNWKKEIQISEGWSFQKIGKRKTGIHVLKNTIPVGGRLFVESASKDGSSRQVKIHCGNDEFAFCDLPAPKRWKRMVKKQKAHRRQALYGGWSWM